MKRDESILLHQVTMTSPQKQPTIQNTRYNVYKHYSIVSDSNTGYTVEQIAYKIKMLLLSMSIK